MTDTSDENPYASPLGAEEPATMPAEAIHGIWRDGDELVLRRRDMKPPKACWVTNRDDHVWRSGVGIETLSNGLAPVLLCYVPIIGVGLFMLYCIGFLLTYMIMSRESLALNYAYRWLSPRYHFWNGFITQCFVLLFFGAIVLSNLSFYAGSLGLALLAAMLVVLQFLLSRYTHNGHSVGLHYFSSGPEIIRVRGVHPDYLARLPAYNESEATTP